MQRVLEAFHQGDYDTAFEVLVRSLTFAHGDAARDGALLLAEAYTLYGEGGLESALRTLEQARESFPDLEQHPLYLALSAEMRALEGEAEGTVRALMQPNPEAREAYHYAQTWLYLGYPDHTISTLANIGALPPFLEWRAHNLRAKAHERMGDAAQAAHNYRKAADIALGLERYWNLLDAAAMWVEAGEGEKALEALAGTREVVIPGSHTQMGYEDPEDGATRYYLIARAHLLVGNPRMALEAIQKALSLEKEGAEPAHGTPLVHGQALMQLGQFTEAMRAFREAANRAEGPDQSYALHELGAAALEAGEFHEAEKALRKAVLDEEYHYLPEAWGDLAEALYRQGRYEEALEAAKVAIDLGAVSAGKLIMGHLAYDLLQLEEALNHYREACEAAEPGSRDWISAQEMAVDVMAQLGFRNPAEMLERIGQVLPYVAPADEWHSTLSGYAERAKNSLGGRTLN